MRTCEKNKVDIWYTSNPTFIEEVDEDGFFTGNTIMTYPNPSKYKIGLYPSGGKIIQEIFGTSCNFDMVSVDMGERFNKDTLIFLSEPTLDYDSTYDYRVSDLRRSLTLTYYGLKRRV